MLSTSTRKPKFGLAVAIASCLVFATAAFAAARVGWHGLTQTERNTRIVERAMEDLGDNTGMSCKVWVQNVVNDASDGAVYPPQNLNDYTWRSHPYVHRYPHPFPNSGFRKGQIIQMRWHQENGTTTPHTAIVVSKTSTGMTWIECNWSAPNVVSTRTVSFSTFLTKTRGLFNVYEIE